MQSTDYAVRVEHIFEGPMDLLIHLIRKNEVDIYDIPVALITEQYLQYLDWMQTLNIDLAGDFILMAATLAQIKSRMLLPVHSQETETEEDPRLELVRPLTEYLRIKEAAEMLSQRNLLGEHTFVRQPEALPRTEVDETPVVRIGLFELIDAFRQILDRVGPAHQVNLDADTISIKDRIAQLVDRLEQQPSLTFDELFQGQGSRAEVIVTFLAILEMARLELIDFVQHVETGIIRIFYR
ncbi:MAG: segregation/condensation protein A [Desulfobacterales bacterium]|jgi:segregation and condensation protein A|nr:segregation/condensation protein A [Desulfobacterales bacterium]